MQGTKKRPATACPHGTGGGGKVVKGLVNCRAEEQRIRLKGA
jgi:hypothetical protein